MSDDLLFLEEIVLQEKSRIENMMLRYAALEESEIDKASDSPPMLFLKFSQNLLQISSKRYIIQLAA